MNDLLVADLDTHSSAVVAESRHEVTCLITAAFAAIASTVEMAAIDIAVDAAAEAATALAL
ncbi:hypothetical protein [Leifsonia xyli]|uniref:hypothetical protein n=1 Tax=Leifsonia xyli TaxID=1575 RepID=UPI00146FB5BC|nr:hypothetical protein [Leifsonia xyli]